MCKTKHVDIEAIMAQTHILVQNVKNKKYTLLKKERFKQ